MHTATPEQRNQIFKVLYGLFRAGAFESESSAQPFNPQIINVKIEGDWDDYFISNCLKVMFFDHPEWKLIPAELAKLFGVTTPKVASIMKSINSSSYSN